MPLLEEFYEFLQKKKVPGGFHLSHLPKLTAKQAFTVIYVMQEYLHILPDNFEQCQDCLRLYDSDSEGYCLGDQYDLGKKTLPKKYWGHYCDNCVPNIDFQLG